MKRMNNFVQSDYHPPDGTPLRPEDLALWAEVVASHNRLAEVSRKLRTPGVDRVGLFRRAFRDNDRITALFFADILTEPELKELFDDLMWLASFGHGAVQAARDLILKLPRAWVLSHIETAANPLLEAGTYDEYRRILELYEQIDKGLCRRLALRASASTDEDVRDAGNDFLQH